MRCTPSLVWLSQARICIGSIISTEPSVGKFQTSNIFFQSAGGPDIGSVTTQPLEPSQLIPGSKPLGCDTLFF